MDWGICRKTKNIELLTTKLRFILDPQSTTCLVELVNLITRMVCEHTSAGRGKKGPERRHRHHQETCGCLQVLGDFFGPRYKENKKCKKNHHFFLRYCWMIYKP